MAKIINGLTRNIENNITQGRLHGKIKRRN